jgi:hypothetical protein
MTPYYQQDGITIYHGDCLDVLPRLSVLPSVLITDPPYTATGGSTNGRSGEADTQFFQFWIKAVAAQIRSAMHPEGRGFVFADWRTINLIAAAFREPGERVRSNLWECKQALVWDREGIGMGAPFRNSFEMIAVVAGPDGRFDHLPKNIPTVVRHHWPYGASEYHGAEKPVELIKKLIHWADARDVPRTILDPFLGSGSTLLAARQLGYSAIGIEIEERNCEIATKRLAQGGLPLEMGA